MTKKDLKIFKDIPTLHTERLTLRMIRTSDIDDVFEYASDHSVSRYLLWSPHKDRLYTRNYLINLEFLYSRARFYDWGIEYSGKMIGTVGFTSFDLKCNEGEIGYVLNRSFWHLGLASEAVRRVLDFGFVELGLLKISARYMAGNETSKRLAERLGFSEDNTLTEKIVCRGISVDVMTSFITRERYLGEFSTN